MSYYGSNYGQCSYGYYGNANGGCYYSGWAAYGRWILLGAILLVAFLIYLMFSCITARRRRRMGLKPMAFTGWAAPAGHGQAQYTGNVAPQTEQGYNMNNYDNNATTTAQPPPAYGYFGGQQNGVTQPAQTHQPVYNAPSGPPPGFSK